jgi:hypothetical protein
VRADIKAQWVAALRSGEYEQGKMRLRSADDKYCCLGVLCEIAVKAAVIPAPVQADDPVASWSYGEEAEWLALPGAVTEWAGLEDANPIIAGESLASWNDGKTAECACGTCQTQPEAKSFSEIADLIQENL